MDNKQRHDYDTQPPAFFGAGYNAERDSIRLTQGLQAVYDVMKDEQWHTLEDIEMAIGKPQASISASIRGLRNPKNGGYYIEREYIKDGLHKYRLDHAQPTNWTPSAKDVKPSSHIDSKYRHALVQCRTHLQLTGYGPEHKRLMHIIETALHMGA
jgi:hypothetical protein